jgi:DNA-binding NarL/FixJ family response regulator
VANDLATLEEAASVLEGSPARLELAKTLAALGTALRRDRRPTEAREPLRRALGLASVCVATMAAEGASNKDIAQALYVTPKTVEVHLSSAYRKLGIRSRRELAGALAA